MDVGSFGSKCTLQDHTAYLQRDVAIDGCAIPAPRFKDTMKTLLSNPSPGLVIPPYSHSVQFAIFLICISFRRREGRIRLGCGLG